MTYTETTDATQSDYDQVGGGRAVAAVVGRFYELIVADPHLAPFFDGVDMPALKRHQVLMVSQVMGGPAQYDGRSMHEANAHLDIRDADFDRVVGHLVAAVRQFDVPDDIIARVGGALESTRSDIVGD